MLEGRAERPRPLSAPTGASMTSRHTSAALWALVALLLAPSIASAQTLDEL